MKLSVIWNLSEKDSDNQITLDCLKTELVDYKDPVQILIYPQNKEQLDHPPQIVNNGEVIISSLIGASEIEVYEDEDFEEYEDDIQYTEDAAETETSEDPELVAAEDAAEPEETDDAEDDGIQYVDEDDADRGDEIEE